jgi:hypothetical protein
MEAGPWWGTIDHAVPFQCSISGEPNEWTGRGLKLRVRAAGHGRAISLPAEPGTSAVARWRRRKCRFEMNILVACGLSAVAVRVVGPSSDGEGPLALNSRCCAAKLYESKVARMGVDPQPGK